MELMLQEADVIKLEARFEICSINPCYTLPLNCLVHVETYVGIQTKSGGLFYTDVHSDLCSKNKIVIPFVHITPQM